MRRKRAEKRERDVLTPYMYRGKRGNMGRRGAYLNKTLTGKEGKTIQKK